MREGSLEAPTRHVIAWQDPDFTDRAKTEAEMRRIFDICHSCRRCFNLCDAFPRLFDLIDNSETGELDTRRAGRLPEGRRRLHAVRHVLHDEVPLCAAARVQRRFPACDAALSRGRAPGGAHPAGAQRELGKTDRNGSSRASSRRSPIGRSDRHNRLTRPLLEKVHGHRPQRRAAEIPRPHLCDAREAPRRRRSIARAPAFGRKAVLYATCFVNYNNPSIGEATRAVLARNGVETEVVYPQCCGMPQLEQGDLAEVAASAHERRGRARAVDRQGLRHRRAGAVLRADAQIRMAADRAGGRRGRRNCPKATFDVSRVHRRHRPQGRAGARPVAARRRRHGAARLPCARAEHGPEGGRDAAAAAREPMSRDRALLRPWRLLGRHEGQFRDRRQGRPAGRRARRCANAKPFVASECPLAGMHILQGMEMLAQGRAAAGAARCTRSS